MMKRTKQQFFKTLDGASKNHLIPMEIKCRNCENVFDINDIKCVDGGWFGYTKCYCPICAAALDRFDPGIIEASNPMLYKIAAGLIVFVLFVAFIPNRPAQELFGLSAIFLFGLYLSKKSKKLSHKIFGILLLVLLLYIIIFMFWL